MKFKVSKLRPYWVRETMIIEADSEEAAEDFYYDNFDPEVEIEDQINWVEEGSLEVERLP